MQQPTPISVSQQIGGILARAKVREDSWSTINELEYLAHTISLLDSNLTEQAKQAFHDAFQKEVMRYLVPAKESQP